MIAYSDIISSLKSIFHNHEYKLFGTYVFKYESDFLCRSKSGYWVEAEIKMSRSDFKKDFENKSEKHFWMSSDKKISCRKSYEHSGYGKNPPYTSIIFSEHNKCVPNKFYFAVPENLISIDECPKYAGLIYVGEDFKLGKIVKNAPFIHKEKNDKKLEIALHKFYYMCVNNRISSEQRVLSISYSSLKDFLYIIENGLNNIDESKVSSFVLSKMKRVKQSMMNDLTDSKLIAEGAYTI